jgi:hypothetical protein
VEDLPAAAGRTDLEQEEELIKDLKAAGFTMPGLTL